MIPVWVLVALRWLSAGALCLSTLSAAVALALSLAGQRQRRLARKLWPLAGISLWSAVCLFMVGVFTNWPGPPKQVPITRLVLPAWLALLGGLLGGYWLRWAAKADRPASARPGVAA
jgi:hypothetical protein